MKFFFRRHSELTFFVIVLLVSLFRTKLEHFLYNLSPRLSFYKIIYCISGHITRILNLEPVVFLWVINKKYVFGVTQKQVFRIATLYKAISNSSSLSNKYFRKSMNTQNSTTTVLF